MIDIGANLTHESFQNDFDDVLQRAIDAGISHMMVTGASAEGSRQALDLARRHPQLLSATAGIHPHHAEETTDEVIALLRELSTQTEVRAIGETGLDYFRDFSPRDVQMRSFRAHLALAVETGLPMFLHERDASEDFAAVLSEYRHNLSDVVVHCFTGDAKALRAYRDMDCYIGITGWLCDERRGSHLISLLHDIPVDRLMIETDAPYLMPRTIRPKPKSRRNEPHYLTWVRDKVAEVLGMSPEEIAARTRANAQRFFRLEA
ncbi:MAG: TatD family hydrolase [Pseudomonadales bacterium]|nr:TatD family hydrolase [Pseudomonadales bacterium]